jgi:hypothetical protein
LTTLFVSSDIILSQIENPCQKAIDGFKQLYVMRFVGAPDQELNRGIEPIAKNDSVVSL